MTSIDLLQNVLTISEFKFLAAIENIFYRTQLLEFQNSAVITLNDT